MKREYVKEKGKKKKKSEGKRQKQKAIKHRMPVTLQLTTVHRAVNKQKQIIVIFNNKNKNENKNPFNKIRTQTTGPRP